MRDKGILESRRDGVHVFYRIRDEKVVRVIDCLRFCDPARG
jgi:DNA-binding transcriptional ArsR family regulator